MIDLVTDIEAKFYEKCTILKIREINGRYIWTRLPKASDKFSFNTFDGVLQNILDICMDGQSFPIVRNRKRVKKWISYAGALYKKVVLTSQSVKYDDFIPILAYFGENGFCVRYANKKGNKSLYYYDLPVFIGEDGNSYKFFNSGIPQESDPDDANEYLGEPRATITGLTEGKKMMIINLPIMLKDGKPLKIIIATNTETEIYDYAKNMRVNSIGKDGALGDAYEEDTDFTFINNKLTIHPKKRRF